MNDENKNKNKVEEHRDNRRARRVLAMRIALFLFALFLFDRLTLLFVPADYRGIPDGERYHTLYFSRKIQLFESERDSVEIVLLGDSRTRHGVDPALLNGGSAFNLAPASGGVEFTDLLVRDYLADAPRLRTIIWGTSPRIFNRYWEDPVVGKFTESPAYVRDELARRRAFNPNGIGAALQLAFRDSASALSKSYSHRGLIKSRLFDSLQPDDSAKRLKLEPSMGISALGFMKFPDAQRVDVTDESSRMSYVASLKGGRFDLDRSRWEMFERLVADLDGRGIELLCFIPPMHGCAIEAGSADADATPIDAYQALVQRMATLETKRSNFRFVDLHAGGMHGFADSDFADFDHLNAGGAARLSAMLAGSLNGSGEMTIAEVKNIDNDVAPSNVDANTAGNSPETNDATAAEISPPVIRGMFGDDDYAVRAFPPDNRPTLWAEFQDGGGGIDVSSARFYINDVDVTDKCVITADRISYKPAETLPAPELYSFRVTVSDKRGNVSEFAWEILLKPC